MLDASALSGMDLSKIVLAIGALGTAAYGLVDASKSFGGGISNSGFGDIKKVVSPLIPASGNSALALTSVLATLKANWMNGMALADQKSIAKALIKLNLTAATAKQMATTIGVDGNVLTSIAGKLGTDNPLEKNETDVYGRFDLLLTALLDQGYQRGDQRYRNSAKLAAIPVAVILALLGAWSISSNGLSWADAWRAVIAGLVATPLAPVAKDLASAIQAGSKVAQAWKR